MPIDGTSITIKGKEYPLVCNQRAKILFQKAADRTIQEIFFEIYSGSETQTDVDGKARLITKNLGDIELTAMLYAFVRGGGNRISFEDAADMIDDIDGDGAIEKQRIVFEACIKAWQESVGDLKNDQLLEEESQSQRTGINS